MSHYQIPVPNPGWAMQPLFPRRPRSLPCWITAYLQYTLLLPLSPPGVGWPFIYTQETPVIPRWLSGRESACQCRTCRRHGFNPWVGKIPWGRKWQPTPIFLPEKFMDRGAWRATVYGVTECQTRLSHYAHTSTLEMTKKSRITL